MLSVILTLLLLVDGLDNKEKSDLCMEIIKQRLMDLEEEM